MEVRLRSHKRQKVRMAAGWSLLGLQAGSIAHWTTPRGEQGSAEILAILYQPESSGDYAM